jgi:methylenetetrahydrofolate dehydrogenase (NADP+)/methenyltetrahydrofolate cyclohydrolase
MALDMTTLFPFRILELLERYGVETKGKHTVVIDAVILWVAQ